jgi:hypothetical protein
LRGTLLAVLFSLQALFVALAATGLWYWRLAIFIGIRLVGNSIAMAINIL